MRQKMHTFDDWLQERMKNPGFRKGYEEARRAVRLGYAVYALRVRLGLTQAELARRMGTRQQVIARLERGDYEGYTLKTLERIAEATEAELVIDLRPRRPELGLLELDPLLVDEVREAKREYGRRGGITHEEMKRRILRRKG